MLTDLLAHLARAPRRPAGNVRLLTSWGELREIEPLWRSQYDLTTNAQFFQSWEWLANYWSEFGADQQLLVAVVEEDSGPVGIVPWVIRRDRSGVGHLRRIVYPLDNWGTSYGPLGTRPRDTLAAAFRCLADSPLPWDLIDLCWVSPEHSQEMVEAWRDARLPFQQCLWSHLGQIDLTNGWDHYWRERSSKWRNNQRRADRTVAERGQVDITHWRPLPGETDDRWDLYDACERVAEASWQGACPSGNTLNHPEVRGYLRKVHHEAVQAGAVHLSLLTLNGQPAAFTYNFVRRGYVLGLRTGYDLRFQDAGVGAVLMRETIRECSRLGDHTFDLGESPSPYKQHWATHFVDSWRFRHASRGSLGAQLMRLRNWLQPSA